MSDRGTLLYIDDERELPAGFENDLREAGYRLLHTSDPDEALMLVRVEEIDLVLAEVVLSSCHGLMLLDEIRSYGGWPAQVPIIVLTKGQRSPELYGGALELGVSEFFTKPASKTELLKSVRQFAGRVLQLTDVDPSEASSTPASEAAISGDLAQVPISEVLRRLRRSAASGVLTVTHRKERKAFELRNGSPAAASASGGVEALEDFLCRRRRISPEQRLAVKERVAEGRGSSGEILMELGVLSKVQFTAAIRARAEEQLLETFRWTSGAFHYFPDKHVRADVALDIDRGQAALMLEGVRRWSPHEVVAEELRPRASLYVSKVEEPPCEPEELGLSSSERVFFEHLYGDRSVREVLDSDDLDARTLYGLFAAGLLVLHEEPVMMLLDTLPSEAESVEEEAPLDAVLEAPSPEVPKPRPPPSPTHEPTRELPPTQPAEFLTTNWNAERGLAELTAFCERIRDEDDFDVLGVGVDATDAEVRYAYEGLLDTLPSEAESVELPGLKELAAEARKRIDKAFDRLQLSSSRKVYAQLRPQVAKGRKKVEAKHTPEQIAAEKAKHFEELASRGLDAEAWFRRGDGFLRLEHYEEAVEAYGMAAHLDPNEGEYLARLGYAQFLHKPKDAVVLQEALENLAKGIKLSPNREKPYVYLGKIFHENGAVDRARKMFKNALCIKPDCHEALEELRRLELPNAKRGKLLDRLKGVFD